MQVQYHRVGVHCLGKGLAAKKISAPVVFMVRYRMHAIASPSDVGYSAKPSSPWSSDDCEADP